MREILKCVFVFLFFSKISFSYESRKFQLRAGKSRSDIPIETDDYDEEIRKDLARFKTVQKKIYELRHLLKHKNEDQKRIKSKVEYEESKPKKVDMLIEDDEIELLQEDLKDIEEIIQDHGANITDRTAKDISQMLKDASLFLNKLESQFDIKKEDEYDYENKFLNVDDDDEDGLEELKDHLTVPSKEDFDNFVFPFSFDRESDKHQHGRTVPNSVKKVRKIGAEIEIRPTPKPSTITGSGEKREGEKVQAYQSDGDDVVTIVVISVSILIVAAVIVGVLVKHCCKKCRKSTSNETSVAYHDDFERQDDIYLEDLGDGDFFEWPTSPSRPPPAAARPPQQQRRQIIVEYSRGYEGYCRLSTQTRI